MSPNYWKRKRERQLKKSLAGVAARERKRLEENFEGPDWVRVRTMLVGVWAHRDGRQVGLWIDGKPWKYGSERTIRGALAKMLYAARTGPRNNARHGDYEN